MVSQGLYVPSMDDKIAEQSIGENVSVRIRVTVKPTRFFPPLSLVLSVSMGDTTAELLSDVALTAKKNPKTKQSIVSNRKRQQHLTSCHIYVLFVGPVHINVVLSCLHMGQ